MAESGKATRPSWWPLQVWGGDLNLSLKGKGTERLDEEIHNAELARLDALIVPALREGLPLFDSTACRERGRIRRYPWRGLFQRREAPFDRAIRIAGDKGIRVWAQIDAIVAGGIDSSESSLAKSHPRWTINNAQRRPTPIGDDHDHFFLCPSNPEVVRLLSEVAVEIANRYAVSALVLDFRHLPHEQMDGGGANCLCFHCQQQAEKELGFDLQEVLDEGTPEVWEEWQTWRNELWIQLVRRIRTQVWTVRPGLSVFIRATPDRKADPDDLERDAPTRFGPNWMEWIRRGLAEMVLLDQPPGARAEAERALLAELPTDDIDSLVLPMVHDGTTLAGSDYSSRGARLSLPGWGLTKHLAEAWSSGVLLKPGPRHDDSNHPPAVEIDPLAASIEALDTARRVIGDAPLGLDVQSIHDTLVAEGRDLDLHTLEGLIFQLSTVVTMLDQERESDRDDEAVPRGWVELARRLLRWHANLHCSELYLFSAG